MKNDFAYDDFNMKDVLIMISNERKNNQYQKLIRPDGFKNP